jgi:ribonuclease P protein component
MISRSKRFHGYSSLNNVYRHGDIIRGPLFAAKYIENKKRTKYRLAVVISKKILKSAVLRNRVRRRLYEQVRQIEGSIKTPNDIVITVFSDKILEISHEEITAMVKKQFEQAKLI